MSPTFPFPRLPYGWFVVARSREISAGEVRTFRYFEHDLVVYRAADGAAHAVEAYCPHLGAPLGEGGGVVADEDSAALLFATRKFFADVQRQAEKRNRKPA